MTKLVNKQYPNDFKQEALALVTEQGYSVVEAAASLNITDKLLLRSLSNKMKILRYRRTNGLNSFSLGKTKNA